MSELERRAFLKGSASALAILPFATRAGAQSANTQAVTNDYARVFQAQSSRPSPLFEALLKAQEGRTPAPSSLKAFRDFISRSPTIKALDAHRLQFKMLKVNPQGLAFTALQPDPRDQVDIGQLSIWNEAIANLTALDHTTKTANQTPPIYGEQFGPPRTSRAYAMMYLAVFEAVGTVLPEYPSYRGMRTKILSGAGVTQGQVNRQTASVSQAIATAASMVLSVVYPKKIQFIDAYLLEAEIRISDDGTAPRGLGRAIGMAAAKAVLAERKFDANQGVFGDGSNQSDPDAPIVANPGEWHQDPITKLKPALGANWAKVDTFAIAAADSFRPPAPYPFDNVEFIKGYKEVKTLGASGLGTPTQPPRWPTPTTRSGQNADGTIALPFDRQNQTFVGIYWGYDGTALLCAPLRLYNMIATSVALHEKPIDTVLEFARYLALINIAMADAGIGAWEAKYHYAIPRPVTYVRERDGDATPEGKSDPRWTPLGAPVTNGTVVGRNLTPPFPAYPSGHATFGATLFQMMSSFYGLKKDDPATKFRFTSDEFNGENRSPGDSQPRPKQEVEFPTFGAAAYDNAQSRIFVGVHWQMDADFGIKQGEQIAEEVFKLYKDKLPITPA